VSETVIATVKIPDAEGTPEIVPEVERERAEGSPVALQE
jgi:hypothetical protein